MSVGLGESAGQCFVQQSRQRFSGSHEISLIGRNIRGEHISGLREDLQGCLTLIGEVAAASLHCNLLLGRRVPPQTSVRMRVDRTQRHLPGPTYRRLPIFAVAHVEDRTAGVQGLIGKTNFS